MNDMSTPDRFTGYIRTRRMARHFGPAPTFDRNVHRDVDHAPPPKMVQTLAQLSELEVEPLLAQLGSRRTGLTDADVTAIRAQSGWNDVAHEPPLPWWIRLWHCYATPFSLLLTLLAVVSYITDDLKATVVIGTMVVLATVLRFWQELRSSTAADALKAMVSTTATVMRTDANTGTTTQIDIPIRELVPGDVIVLSVGDMVPADCRVIDERDLHVSQAALTGESLPVAKLSTRIGPQQDDPLDLETIIFMGTNVVAGAATAVVIHTGASTFFGALAGRVALTTEAPTSFQIGVNRVSWLLIRFMAVMVPLVFLLNGFTKGSWMEALLFALSVAVGLTPELLPMIVTSTLAKGAVFLSRKKVIVKHLEAIQNLGAMDVLCTDKTGTLTQDQIVLAQHLDAWGAESMSVLELAYLNSYYQTGLKNLLDIAVLRDASLHTELEVATAFRKIDEVPFDFTRRRMSVIIAEHDERHVLITKGAVDEVLSVCTTVRRGDASEPLTPVVRAQVNTLTDTLNTQGLRVVAIAVRYLPPAQQTYAVADEHDMDLVGFVAFLDPPKESTAPSLQALAAHGITVKVLSGDSALVTAKVCHDVGLDVGTVVLGSEVERMDDVTLTAAAAQHTVFAKLTPAHKERIVRSLMAGGHTVGFMGDGINDAPALRAADVGISVDTAVDIAKESADIILLEKSLLVLDDGVLEGRRTFANMLKYIKMTVSSNFGNVLSVLVASIVLPFLPMLPMHLLVQNLLYDLCQIAIPFDRVDAELLQRPEQWRARDLGRFMLFFGPISTVFDLTTFAVMWFVFSANTVGEQTLFQSGWFVVGLLTQTLIVHTIRTPKLPFLQSRASVPLMAMTTAIVVIGIALPMGPVASYVKLQALPPLYFAILPGILLAYMALTQVMKGIYIRRFGWQ